jgi:hypothetical protein
MVDVALSIGAGVGIVLSAGFVWWEIGQYAAPQVPESRFNESKAMIGYTAGLFVGIPLALALLLLFASLPTFSVPGIVLFLALLVGGTELAQWMLLRSVYFGSDGAGPFYALGFRAGIGGILILALLTQYFSGTTFTVLGIAAILAVSASVLSLEVVGGVLALPKNPQRPEARGGPMRAAPMEAVGFFLVGYALANGSVVGLVGGAIVAVGAFALYRSLAPTALEGVSIHASLKLEEAPGEAPPSSFRRIER